MKLNKRLLDLCGNLALVLTPLAGMAYEKDVLRLLPPHLASVITYCAAGAAILLKFLAFIAPPTPSPLPEQPKTTKLNP